MKSTYFFRLSSEVAAKQYDLTNPVLAEDGVLCAAWWVAYCRQQPGSGSGTQSLEAKHLHGFRASLVDDEGHLMHRLLPAKFFRSMVGVLKLQGLLLRKRQSLLPDHPTGRDPTSANCSRLKNIGRTTALERLQQRDLIRKVDLSNGVAHVMPRTHLKWQWSSTEEGKGDWEQKEASEMHISQQLAEQLAQVATCHDGGQLLELLVLIGVIVRTTKRKSCKLQLNIQKWMELRVNNVVVLSGDVATQYWFADGEELYVCSCNYFAITGRCEHEQCVHSLLGTGGLDANIVGKSATRGRPNKAAAAKKKSSRGLTSAAIESSRAAAAKTKADKAEKKRVATACHPQPPSREKICCGSRTEDLSDAAGTPFVFSSATRSSASSSSGVATVPTAGEGSCAEDVSRAKGPHLFGTDFDLVDKALKPHALPSNWKIYYNSSSGAAWRSHKALSQRILLALSNPQYLYATLSDVHVPEVNISMHVYPF